LPKCKDLTGKQFERLTVIKRVENNKQGSSQWLCRCNCQDENEIVVVGGRLTSGNTKSCGCLQKENVSKLFKKYNTYILTGDFGIGYTLKEEEFCFKLEDYGKIKDYCWYFDKDGYLVAYDGNKHIRMHRLVMNCPDGMEVDHEFHNEWDNRKEHLRIVTKSQNGMNKNIPSNNTSGIIGVSYNQNNKWMAKITKNKKQMYIGQYENKDDAIKARLEAEQKYFGEFAPQKHLYDKYGIKVVI